MRSVGKILLFGLVSICAAGCAADNKPLPERQVQYQYLVALCSGATHIPHRRQVLQRALKRYQVAYVIHTLYGVTVVWCDGDAVGMDYLRQHRKLVESFRDDPKRFEQLRKWMTIILLENWTRD